MKNKTFYFGFFIALYGTALILLWIGLFKFTPTEAKAIQPLVENSPLMAWMYRVGSVQQVSNFIGTFEIITALLLAAYPFRLSWARIGGYLTVVIFLTTLSFLFTTPKSFHWIDGFLLIDPFILKDLATLGIGLMVVALSHADR